MSGCAAAQLAAHQAGWYRGHPCSSSHRRRTRPRARWKPSDDEFHENPARRPAQMYPKHRPGVGVPANPSLPAIERDVLDYWAGDKTFQASIDARDAGPKGANEFVFYDGPPFANGLPHYGHLLTGYVKDLVPRYQTMRGRRVERRFGWDCHGLPAEVEAEKQLGIT